VVEKNNTSELEEKLIYINRVSKVVKGGRIFSFAALVAVGNREDSVGFGYGRSLGVPDAIEKATQAARRNIIKVNLKDNTLPYSVKHKYSASNIYMQPAAAGTGIIAGGAMRPLLELAGVKNVLAKCYGSTNAVNVVRATFNALKGIRSAKDVFAKRS
jgi:small subunit ribosomal protein S5